MTPIVWTWNFVLFPVGNSLAFQVTLNLMKRNCNSCYNIPSFPSSTYLAYELLGKKKYLNIHPQQNYPSLGTTTLDSWKHSFLFGFDLSKEAFYKKHEALGGKLQLLGLWNSAAVWEWIRAIKSLVMVSSSPNSDLIFKIIASKVNS